MSQASLGYMRNSSVGKGASFRLEDLSFVAETYMVKGEKQLL